MSYVICPATITGPAPHPGFVAATGLGANEPCGAQVPVVRLAPAMDFICPRGHRFYATPDEVREKQTPSPKEAFRE